MHLCSIYCHIKRYCLYKERDSEEPKQFVVLEICESLWKIRWRACCDIFCSTYFLRVMAYTLRGIFVIHVWIYISPSKRIRLIYQEENDSFLSLWSFSPLTNAIKLCVHFLCEKRKQLNILRNLRLRILYAFACEREWFWMAWSKMLKIKCHYYSGKSYTEVSVWYAFSDLVLQHSRSLGD